VQQRLPLAPELDERVREYLLTREYPGNVRDLKQLLFRIADRYAGTGEISAGDVPEDERPVDSETRDWRGDAFELAIRRAVGTGIGLKAIGRAAEDLAIDLAVESDSGNLQRAALKLRVTGRALQMRRATLKRANTLPSEQAG
jgi:DNA-binding NtrC family response regulator